MGAGIIGGASSTWYPWTVMPMDNRKGEMPSLSTGPSAARGMSWTSKVDLPRLVGPVMAPVSMVTSAPPAREPAEGVT